jgi:DNA-binding SARP family transcriptional activator/tetratricopeptide (TPR) repeat protein
VAQQPVGPEPTLIHLVGPFRVVRGGRVVPSLAVGSLKGRRLLKLLATGRGRTVSTDEIVEVLWDASPPPRFEQNVASLISRLRGVLGAGAIEGGRGGYRLTGGHVVVDVEQAARLLAESRSRLAAGEPALALSAARGAIGMLSSGEVLDGEPDTAWVDDVRTETDRIRREARRFAWRAALEVSDLEEARESAESGVLADALDEEAARALMVVHHRTGNDAAALDAYELLRAALSEALGTDPSPDTRDLHLAILRGDESGTTLERPGAPRSAPTGDPAFVGREREVAELSRAWTDAADRRPSLVLLVGEGGVGKSRLGAEAVDLASSTGGVIAQARCFEAERSLFLQPVSDALRTVAVSMAPDVLRVAVGDEAGALGGVVPEIRRILRPDRYQPADAEIERRRSFEAVRSFLVALAERAQVLLYLDDLHNAGSSTLELLHYISRRASRARLLVLATVRIEEGDEVLDQLGAASRRLDVGPLSADAVSDLARRMGAGEHADRLMATTMGHTLSVVESLRALAEGGQEPGAVVPETLRAAVLSRVARTGREVEDLLRVAAVLGSTFDPAMAASMLDVSFEEAARRIEVARRGRLVGVSGDAYSFANDLIREILYQSTPEPTLKARHRRAAALSAANPEAVAWHATAARDWELAVDAWLQAGRRAAARFANRDARRMLDRAVDAAVAADDGVGEARARLERGRVLEALSDFEGAYRDHVAALAGARQAGERAIEMQVLRELGGDPLVGLGRPAAECVPYLESALRIAEELGDREAEVDTVTRLAVLSANRLRFEQAREQARRAVRVARELGSDAALTSALDGMKTVSAYDGDLDVLEQVVPELERVARRTGRLETLQWAILESAFVPMARGQWPSAVARIRSALEVNRRVGYSAHASMFVAHLGWIHRSRGQYAQAISVGRQAVVQAEESDHPWWMAFAAAMLGWTLTETGDVDDAVRTLEAGLRSSERDGGENYLVRCLAHLALAHATAGRPDHAEPHLQRAERILAHAIRPPGSNFLHGAHAALAAARAALLGGSPQRAASLSAPVLRSADARGWVEPQAEASLVLAMCLVRLGDFEAAEPLATRAALVAERAGLDRLTWETRAVLSHVLEGSGRPDPAGGHRTAAIAGAESVADRLEPAAASRFLAIARSRIEAGSAGT